MIRKNNSKKNWKHFIIKSQLIIQQELSTYTKKFIEEKGGIRNLRIGSLQTYIKRRKDRTQTTWRSRN